MNREAYRKEFTSKLELMLSIMTAKNADYASEGDPFKNFRMVEDAGISSLETGILVRMFDKMSRISNLIDTEAKVKDESIADTLVDLANYSLILSIYMESKTE